MKTTKIELFNSKVSQLVEVNVPPIKKDFIDLSEIITQDRLPYLLNFPDKNFVTLLDFTYFSPLIVRSDILNFKTNIFEI